MNTPIPDQSLLEQFKNFCGKFRISLDQGNTVCFFAYHYVVEMIHNFEVYNLLTINETTKRLKGVSFDLTFTEEGRNILLFEEL